MACVGPGRIAVFGALGAVLALVASQQGQFRLAAADSLPPAQLRVGGASISVSFTRGSLDLPQPAILRWVQRAAEAVTAYYGSFPLRSVRIEVHPAEDESGVFHGTTWGYRGGFTRISVGQHTSQQKLDSDWMLTHEMTHMAFPDVPDQHHWIEEGIATYVEPIARAQAGQMSEEKIWAEMVRDMPSGQPGAGDRGLDHTHTWGRTYWGGAMFCLVADVRIRECTHNAKGLQDALRGIVAAGGTIQSAWPVERALQVGDRSTGCTALTDLYAEMKDKPVTVDLNALWRRLGVEAQGRGVVFDDRAALAQARRAILAPAGATDVPTR